MLPDSLCVHKSRLETRDALLSMPDRLQHCLDSGGEPRVVQVDFSGAYDRITSLSSLMTVFQIWKRKGLSKALAKVDAKLTFEGQIRPSEAVARRIFGYEEGPVDVYCFRNLR